MHTNIIFQHPAKFVALNEDDGILSVGGASWFIELLRSVEAIEVDEALDQEDWGVIVCISRSDRHYWIGLSCYPDEANGWLAHIHPRKISLLERFRRSYQTPMSEVIDDIHDAFASAKEVSGIKWYSEVEIMKPDGVWAERPNRG